MNYQKIYNYTISDGPGVRISLYVSGCPLHCAGCHNSQAWDFNSGEPFTPDLLSSILVQLDKPYITGFSLLGGEPLAPQNRQGSLSVVSAVKAAHPEKDIWIWTGYEWNELMKDPDPVLHEILKYLDVAVVGRFILANRDISNENPWRGSRNQRVIDVKSSINADKMILLKNIKNND